MAENRNWQKQHIRAARDWLGKAESSLDQQNDVEGDLKLMLARAELSHVKESPQSQKLKHFVSMIVPLAVAVLLLVVGSWGWQNLLATEKTTENVSTVTTTVEKPLPKDSDESSTQVESKAVASELSPDSNAIPAMESASEPVTSPMRVDDDRRTETVIQSVPKPATSKVPSLEKQQLMQAAGKALRQ